VSVELNNIIRLLTLKDILFEDTDEFHELSMEHIEYNRMKNIRISVDRFRRESFNIQDYVIDCSKRMKNGRWIRLPHSTSV